MAQIMTEFSRRINKVLKIKIKYMHIVVSIRTFHIDPQVHGSLLWVAVHDKKWMDVFHASRHLEDTVNKYLYIVNKNMDTSNKYRNTPNKHSDTFNKYQITPNKHRYTFKKYRNTLNKYRDTYLTTNIVIHSSSI